MIQEIFFYIGGVLLLVGALFCLLAALGLLRLPDLYTRMHASAKAGTVGAGAILLGLSIVCFDGSVLLRALAGISFLVLTNPVSAHLLARAAYLSGLRPCAGTVVDDFGKTAESE